MSSHLDQAAELVFNERRTIGAALMASAAQVTDNADVTWLTRRIAVLTLQDGRQFLVDGPISHESIVGALIVDDKELTRQFLETAGVAVPDGESVTTADEAVRVAKRFDRPAVVKPRVGGSGRGVSVDLKHDSELRTAFQRAEAYGKGVVVEEFIEIEQEFRCMATPRECLAVVKRVLPRITGDGRRSVEELVDEKNSLRRNNPALRLRPILKEDGVLDQVLQRQGLDRASIPSANRSVLVRNVGGLSAGGEPHECSDSVGPAIKSLSQDAVAAIPGLEWAGLDIIVEKNTGRPFVLEININAGFGGAAFPVVGTSQDVAVQAWKLRRDATVADGAVEPHFATSLTAPLLLSESIPGDWNTSTRRRIGQVFFDYVVSSGHHVTPFGKSIFRIDYPHSYPLWFTRSAGGTQDMLGPRRAARRHGVVRRLLRKAGVPRPAGRWVRTNDELKSLMGRFPGPLTAIPTDSDWGGNYRRRVSHPDFIEASGETWFVQRRLGGRRLRIFCSRQKEFSVTTSENFASELSTSQREEAAMVAIRAVRAVPGLRWAAVDVLIRPVRTEADPDHTILVEGISPNPYLKSRELLIAGSLASLFDHIMHESVQTLK